MRMSQVTGRPLSLHSSSVSYKSDRADKPNEDAFVADDGRGLYLIADGVTSTPRPGDPYPQPSGGELAARAFVAAAYAFLCGHLTSGRPPGPVLRLALEAANEAIAALNRAHDRYAQANFLDKDYFGAVGTVAVIQEGACRLLHVGDTLAVLRRGDAFRLLAEIGTQDVAAYQREVRARGIILPEPLAVLVRRDFRNHREARGIDGAPVGYGVFTGEPAAFDFLQSVIEPLRAGDRLLLATDGWAPLLLPALADPAHAAWLAAQFERGPAAWPELAAENDLRAGPSDDKTLIEIVVK